MGNSGWEDSIALFALSGPAVDAPPLTFELGSSPACGDAPADIGRLEAGEKLLLPAGEPFLSYPIPLCNFLEGGALRR